MTSKTPVNFPALVSLIIQQFDISDNANEYGYTI